VSQMLTAGDVMTAEVITVTPETPVTEVVRILAEQGISGVPVVSEGGAVLGIVSEGDILEARPHRALVKAIMTTGVTAVSVDEALPEVASLLISKRIHRVPVLRDGRLVGIITRADLVRAMAARAAAGEARGR
jgi:CBS domain-containing protein